MKNLIRFTVKEILEEIYFNDKDKAVELLHQHDLLNIVENDLSYFKGKNKQVIQESFKTVVVSFLQKINTRLSQIEDTAIKSYLKYILSDIGSYIIDTLIDNKIIAINELMLLESELKTISELNGYDFNDIDNHLKIRRTIRNINGKQHIVSNSSNTPLHYQWLIEDYKLDEISRNLSSEKVISSIKTFKKLFTQTPETIAIDSEKSDFVFILFDILHHKKYIKPKGTRGKFAPLCQYSYDFQKNILFKKEPKYIKQEIKQNPKKYDEMRMKAEKWINDF